MIWIIANKAEEDGSYPTYKFYKKAFNDSEIDIFCADNDSDFSFLRKEDIAVIRTRDVGIAESLRKAKESIGFNCTVESKQTCVYMYDKDTVKSLLNLLGVPCPQTVKIDEIADGIKYFVKPKYGENSIGIDERSLCSSKDEVISKCDSLSSEGFEPIIEEYIDGYDVTASVVYVGNGEVRVDAIKDISDCEEGFVTYNDKDRFINDQTNPILVSAFNDEAIVEMSRKVFNIVGAKHYMRIDFRVSNGVPYVIDLNMIPGLAPNGYMSRCLRAHGVGYHDMVRMVVNSALC